MFERRLWWLLALLSAFALALIVRLTDLQVVNAATHAQLIEKIAPRQVQFIRAPRGSILDRQGRPLLSDTPCSDVTMYYRILSGDPEYLRSIARRLRGVGEFPSDQGVDQIVPVLQQRIYEAVQTISRVTEMDMEELEQRRWQIIQRVGRVRSAVERSNPVVAGTAKPSPWRPLVREENAWHTLIENLEPKTAIALQMALRDDRWVRVQPGSQRRSVRADSLAHLLGRMGAATSERIESDSEQDNELRALRGGDQCGVSGFELLAEHELRGTAGRIVTDPNHGVVERIDPVRGRDVFLTVDIELQDQIYKLLEAGVQGIKHPAGGAAVVMDANTREVLAAVSYPTYRFDEYRARYGELIRDLHRMPTKARAVQVAYPPGSTCKAITAIGALTDGVISAGTRFHCNGYLLPDSPNRFRCWIYNSDTPSTHDASFPDGQTVEDAIRNSCNLFFFRAGEKLGPARLCDWFSALGLGGASGTGLIEESRGTVPTAEWLNRVAGRQFQRGDEWNWSIGQGEITATPLQVANVCATIATGAWKPVVMARDADGRALSGTVGDLRPRTFDSGVLRHVRSGMWRVVNEYGGTAYKHARLENTPRYVLCGKTGSAQAQPLVLNYRFIVEWPDGAREEVIATSAEEALEQFGEDPPKIVGRFANDRYPVSDKDPPKLPAHAWFMGFTQSSDVRPGDLPRGRVYAISVIVEFGEGGGGTAGPVAKQIAELLLNGPLGAG